MVLNKVKIKSFEVWDGETGEADVIAQFANGKILKAFTLDSFESNQEIEIIVSLFCKDYQIVDDEQKAIITNTDENYKIEMSGKIVEYISDIEQGEIVVVDVGGVFINVYVSENNVSSESVGKYFIGNGRLDIENEFIS